MLLQIEAGTLDMMGDPLPAAQFTDVTTNPDYEDQIYHHTLVDTDYVFMDTQMPDNGPFSNVKVRQAVNYAIDKAAILQISHGAGVEANCIFPPRPARLRRGLRPVSARRREGQGADEGGRLRSRLRDDASTRTRPIPIRRSAHRSSRISPPIGIKANIVSQEFATFLDTIETPHKAPHWLGRLVPGLPGSVRLHRPDPVVRLGGQGRCERGPLLQQGSRRDGRGGARARPTPRSGSRTTRRSRPRSWPTPRGRRSGTRSGTR